MKKVQYVDPTGKVYPSSFIVDRCSFDGFKVINGETYEVYKYVKGGCAHTIYVQRFEVNPTDLPYGFYDDCEMDTFRSQENNTLAGYKI